MRATSLLLLAGACLACASSSPRSPAVPRVSDLTDVALRPDVRVDASPNPIRGRLEIGALYKALFEEGKTFEYRVTDDVDPHDADGGHVVTETLVHCRIRDVAWMADAASSTLACQIPPGERGQPPLPTSEWGFLLTRRGLAMAPAPLTIGNSEPPLELLEAAPRLACSDVRGSVAHGYGDTHEVRCFSPGLGMKTLLRENLEGPRTITWTLVEPQGASFGPPVTPAI